MAKSGKVKVKKDGWKQLVKRVTPLGEYQAHVGVLSSQGGENAYEHKGGNAGKPKITLIELAAIHEFGSPKAHVPERSFIRQTFNEREGQNELKELYAKLAKLVINGRMEPERAIEILGMRMQAMVKRRITVYGLWPPNHPITVARKGSSTPLVDTGQLLGAITYEVRRKKK